MNYKISIFIQGEGKGHFSQAMETIEILEERGFQVIQVYLGRNLMRKIPGYFKNTLRVSPKPYLSPNFIRTPDRKGIRVFASILANILLTPVYLFESIRIAVMVRKGQPDMAVNFYEPLAAVSMKWWNRRVPQAIISHHFYLSHPDFIHPHGLERSYFLLQWMNRIMLRKSDLAFALSFRDGKPYKKIQVIPPIISRALRSDPEIDDNNTGKGLLNGDRSILEKAYDLCYFLNEGFVPDALRYYARYPDKNAAIFTERSAFSEVPPNVRIYSPSREIFLRMLENCQRLVSTAGFDLVAEAFYLGKPVLLLPSENHYEQYCNALDAARTGMAIQLEDLTELEETDFQPSSNRRFKDWWEQGELLLPSALNTYLSRFNK